MTDANMADVMKAGMWLSRNGFIVASHLHYSSLWVIVGANDVKVIIPRKDAPSFAKLKGWQG